MYEETLNQKRFAKIIDAVKQGVFLLFVLYSLCCEKSKSSQMFLLKNGNGFERFLTIGNIEGARIAVDTNRVDGDRILAFNCNLFQSNLDLVELRRGKEAFEDTVVNAPAEGFDDFDNPVAAPAVGNIVCDDAENFMSSHRDESLPLCDIRAIGFSVGDECRNLFCLLVNDFIKVHFFAAVTLIAIHSFHDVAHQKVFGGIVQ